MNRHSIVILFTLGLTLNLACKSGVETAKQSETKPVATAPTVAVTTVQSQELNRKLRLPGELQPYQDVLLYPKVQGFIEAIVVDRGSVVRAGQLLVRLSAPEIGSQRAAEEAMVSGAQARKLEAEARVGSARAQRIEAEAKLAAMTATYNRLKSASITPGVVSGNELENAQRQVEAEQARVRAYQENEQAARAQVKAIGESEAAARAMAQSAQTAQGYLRIVAPFDGIITERHAHQGTLAGPSQPVLRLQQISRLRLVVPVPEAEVASVRAGAIVPFTVPAFPGQTFNGRIARISNSVDSRTRTMPIELDVDNPARRLSPGMFPQVTWPSNRSTPSLLVPPATVAVTTERTFVIRIRDGVTEWVDVKRGVSINLNGTDLVEIFGDLAPGDQIAARGTDELRAGTKVKLP